MRARHPGRPRLKAWNTFTLWILHVPIVQRLADGQVCELRFTARRSGQQVVLPVMYAQRGNTLVILVGGPEHQRWWRNFARPYQVQVWLRGVSRSGTGRVVNVRSTQRAEVARIYTSRFPDLPVEDDPMVVIELEPSP
jgi:hypothetical protein